MSIINRILTRFGVAKSGLAGFASDAMTGRFFGPSGYGFSQTKLAVTQTTALTAAAVYAAVRAVSEDVAKMPVLVERAAGPGTWVRDETHPLNDLLRRPNLWQSGYDCKAFATTCYAMRGNAYVVVIRNADGSPRGLVPVHPDRVGVNLAQDGSILYAVTHPLVSRGDTVWVSAEDMIHIRGTSLDGYTGLSTIQMAAESIGVTLAAQQMGAKLFGNGAIVSGTLSTPDKLSPEAAARMASDWQAKFNGVSNANAHGVAVLEQGLRFEKISLTAEESQFLETRSFQIPEIARWFRIPPHKLGHLDEAHYNNLEQQEAAYVADALLPIATRFEEEFHDKLLFQKDRGKVRVRFDFDALIKPDLISRYQAHLIGLQNGFLNANEVRAIEGMNPIPGGEEYRVSVQVQAPGASGPAGTPPGGPSK